jgi:GDPmannose 4,6-dehydratase
MDAKRDWSDAEDFVEGVWMMLNQDVYNKDYDGSPKEYVFSSNETHTIREFVEKAFKASGIDGSWIYIDPDGRAEDEIFCIKNINGKYQTLVKINPKFYRPAEVELLLGDSTLARKELGWKPKILFDNLVEKMVRWDLENYKP